MINKDAGKGGPDDRRRYFRLDDTINLSYQEVPPEELPERLEQLKKEGPGEFAVMSGLSLINQQMSTHLHRIEAAYPDIAAYLKALDNKVDMLGRALLTQGADMLDHPTRLVNISAGGMAVACDETLQIGALLEVKIMLLPSLTGILAYGEVVGCDKNTEEDTGHPYLLRVDFTHLREADQDVLIRHLLRRQGEMLRQRREERYNEK